jgi:hypothetical protein
MDGAADDGLSSTPPRAARECEAGAGNGRAGFSGFQLSEDILLQICCRCSDGQLPIQLKGCEPIRAHAREIAVGYRDWPVRPHCTSEYSFFTPIRVSICRLALRQTYRRENKYERWKDWATLDPVHLVRAALSGAARRLSATLLRGQVPQDILVGTASVWRTSSRRRCLDYDRHQERRRGSVHASSVR